MDKSNPEIREMDIVYGEELESEDTKNGVPPFLFVLNILFTSIFHLISSFLLCFLIFSLRFLNWKAGFQY